MPIDNCFPFFHRENRKWSKDEHDDCQISVGRFWHRWTSFCDFVWSFVLVYYWQVSSKLWAVKKAKRNILKMPSQEVVTTKVVVHPLVLLSVVDHFNRMGKIGNQKRVVGVLLGCWRAKGVLDVSNSFAGN